MQQWQFQKKCWNRFKNTTGTTHTSISSLSCVILMSFFCFLLDTYFNITLLSLSSWFTKISSTQTRHRFFLPMLQTTNFLLSCLFWHMWYNCPKHPSPQKSTSETKKQYLNHCTSTPYWKSSRTCSSPRHPLFLHALSFECTSKLCINVLNQFSVYFHIQRMHNTI